MKMEMKMERRMEEDGSIEGVDDTDRFKCVYPILTIHIHPSISSLLFTGVCYAFGRVCYDLALYDV